MKNQSLDNDIEIYINSQRIINENKRFASVLGSNVIENIENEKLRAQLLHCELSLTQYQKTLIYNICAINDEESEEVKKIRMQLAKLGALLSEIYDLKTINALKDIAHGLHESKFIKKQINTRSINSKIFNQIGWKILLHPISVGPFQGMSLLGLLLLHGYGCRDGYKKNELEKGYVWILAFPQYCPESMEVQESQKSYNQFCFAQAADAIQFISNLTQEQQFILLTSQFLNPTCAEHGKSLAWFILNKKSSAFHKTLWPWHSYAPLLTLIDNFTELQHLALLKQTPLHPNDTKYGQPLLITLFDTQANEKYLSKNEIKREELLKILKESYNPLNVNYVFMRIAKFLSDRENNALLGFASLFIPAMNFRQIMEGLKSCYTKDLTGLFNFLKNNYSFFEYNYQEVQDYFNQLDDDRLLPFFYYLSFKKLYLNLTQMIEPFRKEDIKDIYSHLLFYYGELLSTSWSNLTFTSPMPEINILLGMALSNIDESVYAKICSCFEEDQHPLFLDIQRIAPSAVLEDYSHYLQIKGAGANDEGQMRILAISYAEKIAHIKRIKKTIAESTEEENQHELSSFSLFKRKRQKQIPVTLDLNMAS
ncbi:MAG: hypothetical protein QM652_13845 [Legionella sp.]|uniref:hypothetical protein n=1 Tax=Legionella sp. TaxID=459 RepID=UPI0039E494F0